MKVIINADDFGFSRGVNNGIIDAFREGIVRSTTLMAGANEFDHAVSLAKNHEALGVGVHLTLTYGKPILVGHKSIVDQNGMFLKQNILENNQYEIDLKEVEAEYIAQIEKVCASGIRPTHLDSHHHVHMMETVLPVFFGVAQKYGLPVRLRSPEQKPVGSAVKCPDWFEENFFGENVTTVYLTEVLAGVGVLEKAKQGILEIMCHPAYPDQALYEESSYHNQRLKELKILTSQEIKDVITNHKIEIANFGAL